MHHRVIDTGHNKPIKMANLAGVPDSGNAFIVGVVYTSDVSIKHLSVRKWV
jgi:hypothetical protein